MLTMFAPRLPQISQSSTQLGVWTPVGVGTLLSKMDSVECVPAAGVLVDAR